MEATKIKMNMDGTFRAKVLQYKPDGNTLTEKWHTLTKFAEGIYFSYTTPDRYGHRSVNIIFSKNGIFWRIGGEPEHYFNPDSFRYAEHMEILKRRYADYEADIMQAATNGGWLNKLHITVMERLGHDTTAMIEAYNERRRKMEELDRQRAEEAERRERERMEAEERRKAEVLADGKEKLLKHERITVEQIELIAEAVGYKINIRTIGFMRDKVTEAVLREDDTVTVWGRKLTSRNIDGTAKVMRELYNRLKTQAEAEANKPVKHISEIMEENNLHGVGYEQTDERRYFDWLRDADSGEYRTIAEQAMIEALTGVFVAAYRKGKGHITAVNRDGVLVETVIAVTPTETPRIVRVEIVRDFDSTYYANLYDGNGGCHNLSKEYTDYRKMKSLCKREYSITLPNLANVAFEKHGRKSYAHISAETPQTIECAADTPKPRETAQKQQNWGIGRARAIRHSGLGANGYAMLDDASATLTAMSVPRECSTADAAYW